MTNSQRLNSAYYCFFRNLPMIAYLIEIQKSKFESEFDQSESGRLIKFRVYFYTAGYKCQCVSLIQHEPLKVE